ncbi:hypothetical protein CROQUDRAFT_86538 [Cronartium quercuum f. sp. fusiforme G11]|uniref:Uncharacterized protein n=1 Tax=Cronartium quercuum f. sp. fusiforme G11 TaxID=708437 RepID=A0A9P6NQI6_9BASI|nr:hypothetical protein CROQUDRAFT_86538 [Cronartium quercuum f. sp. fusiforme G11]
MYFNPIVSFRHDLYTITPRATPDPVIAILTLLCRTYTLLYPIRTIPTVCSYYTTESIRTIDPFTFSIALFSFSIALFSFSIALFSFSIALFSFSIALFSFSIALFDRFRLFYLNYFI